jgi:mediator of replication checkpoint protein 1
VGPRLASRPIDLAASDDETDEDIVRRPARSNTSLVARLAAEAGIQSASSGSEAEENAYERVKRQLLESKQVHTATKESSRIDSESDDIPIAARSNTRRRRIIPARSSSPVVPSSPGLFVSPEKTRSSPHATRQDSDSDSLPNSNRLADLVARKRAKRLAREKTEEEAAEARLSSPAVGRSSTTKKKTRRAVEVESETDDDKDIANKLASSARPTRKAGKKALEEMHRETQRMSRNMQLTHEAKTKVKFTTDDLFKKFNFRQSTIPAEAQPQPSVSSSIPGTADTQKQDEAFNTPPSSPPIARSPKITVTQSSPLPAVPTAIDSDDEDLPDINSALSDAVEKATQARKALSSPARKTRQTGTSLLQPTIIEDNDDDLEIVGETKPARFAIFDLIKPSKARSAGSSSLIRALAQSNDTRKAIRKGQPSMTTAELQITLQRRAREQAQQDREEKIQRLRERGVYVQTAEEKIKEQMQIEDMLERARREADELAQREKEAAKKEGREVDGAMPDSDDDSDYDGEEPEADVDMSGSSGEEDGDDDVGVDDDEEIADTDGVVGLVDEVADEEVESEDDVDQEEADALAEDSHLPHIARRPRKNVIDSEDEDEEHGGIVLPITIDTPARPLPAITTPKSALADAFGFAQPQAAVGDLSNMFMGTMAESQVSVAGDTQAFDTQEHSLAFFRGLPQPSLPDFDAVFADDSQDVLVASSQADQTQHGGSQSQQGLFRFETQTQMQYTESQASQVPEPTQDVGFQHVPTPIKPTPESFHTVDTLRMSMPLDLQPEPAAPDPDADGEETQLVVKKKGRLVRRDQRIASVEADEVVIAGPDQDEEAQEEEDADPTNAFLIMRKAVDKPTLPAYNKKNSEAKAMIEEQAEESEDEYAGLGGNSDDEDGEFDEETKKIIDDESNEKMNERAMAKFHADKERDEDEKRVSKLFKDIANGGLRRKRGAEMELWDSDDEDEAAARRRAAKQREFAKMRKALLADEALGKIGMLRQDFLISFY